MKILVTGGCGYIGTELIKVLLKQNHKVISIDKKIFGDYLPIHKNLKNLKLCVSQITKNILKGVDTVIHLAAISNDPAAILNSKITWETNVLYTLKLLNVCKEKKIKKFIFASSGSVYGISKKNRVDEQTELVPITDYNKTKMIGEKLVENFKKYFSTVILRPGTVCGYSDNIRLDLTVNAMTLDALRKGIINVNGGKQIRPQLHIGDMIRSYLFFLKNKKTGIFNVGFENYSISKIADMIDKNLKNVKIIKNSSLDVRSYKLYAGKLLSIGFKRSKSSNDAITDLIKNFNQKKIKDRKTNLRSVFLSKNLKKFYG
tara:strand:+ start:806 stop:1753 length:948 start_codon:yes stop_codon:yes gene_type:complete